MAYCGHCGKYVKDGTEICPECGCYTIAKSGTKQIASSGANQVASTELILSISLDTFSTQNAK